MRRRWSGLLAAIAVAQLSLGGMVAPCLGGQAHPSAMPMQGMSEHVMMDQQPGASAAQDPGDSTDHSMCDHSGAGMCAGMLSCSVAIGSTSPARVACSEAHDRVTQSVNGLRQEPRPSPETPPPRV